MEYFEFIETPVFSRQRETLLDDDSFRELQTHLLKYHVDGDTISKTGGYKKIRWNRPGMGKQGGVRVIYYVITRSGKLYLLIVYPKNAKDDLTEAEKAILKALTDKLN
ncbi:type II toxin-antitoxin system RelE/ParE family toxin [Serratia fonticola]|uniref:type II toxin-antitoxin system RelE/ParE family toxin n=1 Tax=Serratia fonticola TaxID=47917 RepID=UPI0039865591